MHYKVIIIIILGVILLSLGVSYYFISKDNGRTHRAVMILSWALLLCAALLIVLLIGVSMGWVIIPAE